MMKLKKILAFASALCMVCAVVPFYGKYVPETAVSASAEEEAAEGTYKNLKYRKYADYVEISGVSDKKITKAAIPAEIEGLPVTSIGRHAFDGCASMTAVTIPDSVTSIADYAFYSCQKLTDVTFSNNVTSIGTSAFHGCASLTAVTLPDSVTSIGEMAFYSCTSLTDVTIPDSVISIGVLAFSECTALTAVAIPDSVTSIGEMAFYNCTGLTAVAIPSSVTSIGEQAFAGTPWLEKKQQKNPLVIVNHILIDGTTCSKEKVTIPDSVTSIGKNAFDGCTSLTAVIIPESVTSIGKEAFHSCTSLTAVTIPDSVTSIGASAFGETPWLAEKQKENALVVINHILIDGTTCSKEKVTVPDGVTSIGDCAFEDCESLTAVTIPDSVTSIRESAFSGCTNLTAVTIPVSVTSIGENAFAYCDNLKAVTIENPDCEIYDSEKTICSTIYGYENSTAQAYAEKYGRQFVSVGSESEENDVVPGDADGNGKVDILDVISINKAILGRVKFTDRQLKAVDFNNNGKPEASESLMIMKYIVGLIESFTE